MVQRSARDLRVVSSILADGSFFVRVVVSLVNPSRTMWSIDA